MEQHLKLSDSNRTLFSNPSSHRRFIGRLLYLTITRPDILYTVNILSQFMHQPCQPHMDVAHCLLRYLKWIVSQGIFLLATSDLRLSALCNSDWACCPMTRRSISDYCILLGFAPIPSKTKEQTTVPCSSAEVEY
ncbi:hypothetical protein CFOL_v3_11769 [Cephalotus follicularis]|uniref:Mitochondrial protein n=1 Tax=Cephalotus follicularis TaxID=3775 RepID=A0A1Q3BJQ0_CEPFO|nr:hypothetical protein CFOL_v3_11769 [Cephalotus follicularis]